MFCFDFQPMGGLDLLVTGRSHFLLGKHSLSFNNVMITLTSACWSTGIVELTSGILFISLPIVSLFNLAIMTEFSIFLLNKCY